jgi:hypothetical protein
VSGATDFGLCLVKKDRPDTGSAGRSVHEDLLHLIALHDNESYNLAVRLGHPHVLEPVSRAGDELVLLAMGEEFRRDVPEVTVEPSDVPDPGYDADIVGCCLAKSARVGSGRQF